MPCLAQEAGIAAPLAAAEGTVAAYRAQGLSESPVVQQAFARWEAAAHHASGIPALPEPTVGLAVFVRAIETRTGPQQARVSVRQALPWPASWRGQRDAAGAEALARAAELEAVLLVVGLRIEEAYWTLWALRTALQLHEDHLVVLEGLSDVVRARLEVGEATLADLQQVDLSSARLEDTIATMRMQETLAAADLREAVGYTPADPVPTTPSPVAPAWIGLSDVALHNQMLAHPTLSAAGERAEAARAEARVARAQRLPGLSLQTDWTLIGDGEAGGQDALALGVGLSLPLWQRAYAAQEDAAHAQRRAEEAGQDAVRLTLEADVQRWSAWISDSARRIALTAQTLLPQAEAAYRSLLGSYTTGEGTVAQVLLAQRDLLELRAALVNAQADHAIAWARLESVCGPVQRQEDP